MTEAGLVALTINGATRRFSLPAETQLLFVLRNDCGLNGPKFGCGLGECGACTVLVDDRAVRSCTTRIGALAGRRITTLEGLSESGEAHPVQQAFAEMQAAQCGYCLKGMIMTTVALLRRNSAPDEAEIRTALARNLCRCGAHLEILAAVRRSRAILAGASAAPEAQP